MGLSEPSRRIQVEPVKAPAPARREPARRPEEAPPQPAERPAREPEKVPG
jgi:hypothetical protein